MLITETDHYIFWSSEAVDLALLHYKCAYTVKLCMAASLL